MQDPRIKLVILGLVFLLSTVFFWSMTNRFLYPSRAGAQPVSVFFDQKQALASESGEVQINVFLAARSDQNLSASSLTIQYPSDKVSFVEKEESFVDRRCKANSFAFEKQIKVVNEPEKNRVTISRVTMKNNKELSKGLMCWGTLVFRLLNGVKSAEISLIDDPAVEIVGPGNIYYAKYGDGAKILVRASGNISITPTPSITWKISGSPIPTISVSPTPIGLPPSCETKNTGDIDCSGKCDLRDFEVFRREKVGIVLTKKSDVNSDGRVDLIDFNIWKRCYFGQTKPKRRPRITPIYSPPIKLSVPINNLIGVIAYEGEGIDKGTTFVEGFNYIFHPSDGQDAIIKKTGIDMSKNIILFPRAKLNPKMDDQTAKVTGSFIKNYREYLRSINEPVSSSDPTGQVILVQSIEIIIGTAAQQKQ